MIYEKNRTALFTRSRQELEKSIRQDRQELEELLIDHATFLRKRAKQHSKEITLLISEYNTDIYPKKKNNLENIANLKRTYSVSINELRKHQLIEQHNMRIRQYDNLQKKRTSILADESLDRTEKSNL